MQLYAIRHKLTGKYLSWSKKRNQTSAELSDVEPPRMFKRKHHAEACLRHWLNGISYIAHTRASWIEPENWDICTQKMPDRKADEMEIVSFKINVVRETGTTSFDVEVLACANP